MKKSIIVTIASDGKIEVTAEGYKGKSCLEATKFIEAALGLDGKNRKPTADMYATEKAVIKQRT
jgi:hypothetical protein